MFLTLKIYKLLLNINAIFFRFEKAVENYKKSLEIKENIHGKIHLSVAKTLKNLAITLIYLEEYDQAYNYSLESCKIKKKLQDPDNLEIAENLTNLAWLANRKEVNL